MTTFDMNTTTDHALKMDVYAIYLRKSRADLETEKQNKLRGISILKKLIEDYLRNTQYYKTRKRIRKSEKEKAPSK